MWCIVDELANPESHTGECSMRLLKSFEFTAVQTEAALAKHLVDSHCMFEEEQFFSMATGAAGAGFVGRQNMAFFRTTGDGTWGVPQVVVAIVPRYFLSKREKILD